MKLSWKDIVTTLLLVAGGAVVYAKFYNYSWAVIGSWKSSVAVLAAIGLVMFAFSSFNFANRSILNIGEMMFGAIAVGLALTGMIATSQPIFYILAAVLGSLWLVDTARHARHSWIGESAIGTNTFHHHAPVH
ncbi:MAG: hypothetical protein ACXWLH_02365 [Candidatus Saccharimonadales bacterium]